MKTPLQSIIFAILSTVFVALANLSYKFGVDKLSFSIIGLITNVPVILGIFFYGIAGVLMILALRQGELSVIHPFYGLSFVWVLLASVFVLNEPAGLNNVIGVVSIIFGVILIGGR